MPHIGRDRVALKPSAPSAIQSSLQLHATPFIDLRKSIPFHHRCASCLVFDTFDYRPVPTEVIIASQPCFELIDPMVSISRDRPIALCGRYLSVQISYTLEHLEILKHQIIWNGATEKIDGQFEALCEPVESASRYPLPVYGIVFVKTEDWIWTRRLRQ